MYKISNIVSTDNIAFAVTVTSKVGPLDPLLHTGKYYPPFISSFSPSDPRVNTTLG